MTGGVKKKLVQLTEFYQPYPLRKTRKTEARNTQELYDPTLTDIRLGESDHGSDDSSADRRFTESSDWNSNSSCSPGYSYFLDDGSLLMDLEIPLTENEEKLIGEFCKEMENVEKENNQRSALRFIQEITETYLKEGIRLNACYGEHYKTVTNLVFEEVVHATLNEGMSPANRKDHSDCDKEILSDESKEIMRKIIKSLFSKGGKVKEYTFFDVELGHVTLDSNYTNSILAKCGKIKNNLKNVAYESIVNKDKQTKKDELGVEMDNGCFYIKYPQDSTVEVAKILSNGKNKGLKLRVGILQIGKSIVRVESDNGKRNYLDVCKQGVTLSFDSEAGKISIHLNPKEDSNEIEVKLDESSEKVFQELKKSELSLGENCLLGGKSVLEAIRDGNFERNRSIIPMIAQPNAATNTPQSHLEDISFSWTETNHKTKEQGIRPAKWRDMVMRQDNCRNKWVLCK
ncbi:hypothetical protein [Wolbachia endosymbiont (group A) of Longitarsus flavicornis]|uniref:hypothetical protein n=1 Tax=Wolbachia endosymbiont (group A) of Longitarsus flavicornis TaxID=3066134 RepID=UPI0030CA4BC4